MFKIHDDKVYFVAETPDINKVIEIFLPKDDRGTIMDSHEIRVDLCRAVIHMEEKGVRVLKVRNIEDTNKANIDIWHMPEYQEAAESPVSDVVNSNIYKKREPHVDKLEYEFNKTGNIDFYSGELYLNAIGDVVSGCDWSYKSQKKYRFGNVMNKNWLENISNSELYIAS